MRARLAGGALVALLTPTLLAWTVAPAAQEPPEPVVTVVGAAASGLAVTSRDPSLAMQVQLQAGQVGAADVELAVSDLRSETGAVTPVTLEGNEVGALAGGQVAAVGLTSALPEPGTWTGVLTVTHDGTAQDAVVLVVTRTRSVTTVEVDAVGVVDRVLHPLLRGGRTEMELTLHETAGQDVRLSPPRVTGLGRVDGDVAIAPHDPQAELEYRVDRGDWTQVDATGLVVEGSGQVQLRLGLPSVNSPGIYTATVQISEPGGTPTSTPIRFRLRYAWWIFALCVVAGLGLAHLVPVVLRGGRERSLLEARLRDVVAGLPTPRTGDADELALVTALVAHEAVLRGQLVGRAADRSAIDTKVTVLEAQAELVPRWMQVHRFVTSVEPAHLVTAHRVTSARLGDELGSNQLTQERATALAAELATLATEAETAVAAALRSRLDELVTLLDQQESMLAPAGASQVSAVRSRLGEASAQLNNAELGAGSRSLASAEHLLIGLLLDDARAAAAAPPHWVSAPYAERLAREVNEALALTSGPRERLLGAQRALVRVLVDAARDRLDTILDPDLEADVAAVLDQADVLVPTDVAGARAQLARAVTLAGGFLQQQRGAVVALRALWTPPEVATPILVTVDDVHEEQTRARRDAGAATRRAARFGTASSVVAGVVALVIGTLVLYVTDPEWGVLADIATAVLWGLGIQATAGFSFQGLAGLRDQLERPSAPAPA